MEGSSSFFVKYFFLILQIFTSSISDSPHSNPVGANVCLPPKEILKLLVDEEDIERSKRMARSVDDSYNELMAEIKFTPESFMKICPVLLSQIEEEACKDRPIIKDMKNDTQQMYWCKLSNICY